MVITTTIINNNKDDEFITQSFHLSSPILPTIQGRARTAITVPFLQLGQEDAEDERAVRLVGAEPRALSGLTGREQVASKGLAWKGTQRWGGPR